MIYIFLLILGLLLLLFSYLNHPLFGKKPSGERLEKIKKSPQYKNKQFQNFSPTPQLTEGYTMPKVIWNFLFKKPKYIKPKTAIPTVPVDFSKIDLNKNCYYWFGHSSYLLILDEKTFLIDPVLTPNAAPVISSNTAFKGTTFIDLNNLPTIDFLLITHDHYDHLDYTTIRKIKPKVKNVICGLGVGSHFEFWGYNANQIQELDWKEKVSFKNNLEITATPARHFSGRSFFNRNNTLFCSYVIKSNTKKIFIGGDSGYDSHFKAIGLEFGPFDYAFIENGQYNQAWRYIHLLPEEMPLVIQDINANVIVPVHHSKFALATHHWKEPLEKVVQYRTEEIIIQTPKIGECVYLEENKANWENWWKKIQ